MYFTVKPFIKLYCLRLSTMWLRASRPFKTRVRGFSASIPSASSLIFSGNQEIASENIRTATKINSYEKLPTRLDRQRLSIMVRENSLMFERLTSEHRKGVSHCVQQLNKSKFKYRSNWIKIGLRFFSHSFHNIIVFVFMHFYCVHRNILCSWWGEFPLFNVENLYPDLIPCITNLNLPTVRA